MFDHTHVITKGRSFGKDQGVCRLSTLIIKDGLHHQEVAEGTKELSPVVAGRRGSFNPCAYKFLTSGFVFQSEGAQAHLRVYFTLIRSVAHKVYRVLFLKASKIHHPSSSHSRSFKS